MEKALKGFLTAHEQIFRKTHDLDELGRACAAIDPTLLPLVGSARDLTVFAWEYRYPGATEVPSAEEAQQVLMTVRTLTGQVLSRLPSSVQP